MKFENEIPKQTWVMLPKPCRLQSPETEKSDMATRQPFRKWGNWASIGSYSYYTSIGPLKFRVHNQSQTKVKSLETKKFQYGCQVAILKLTPLKINRLLPQSLATDMRRLFYSTWPPSFSSHIKKEVTERPNAGNEIPASGAIIMPRNTVTTGTIDRS